MWLNHHGTIGRIDVKLIENTRTIAKTTRFSFINGCTCNNGWQMGQSMVGIPKIVLQKTNGSPSIEVVL